MIGVCYVIVEDLVHFLSVCEEFREDRRLLLMAIVITIIIIIIMTLQDLSMVANGDCNSVDKK